jgi:hypothetical protein
MRWQYSVAIEVRRCRGAWARCTVSVKGGARDGFVVQSIRAWFQLVLAKNMIRKIKF